MVKIGRKAIQTHCFVRSSRDVRSKLSPSVPGWLKDIFCASILGHPSPGVLNWHNFAQHELSALNVDVLGYIYNSQAFFKKMAFG